MTNKLSILVAAVFVGLVGPVVAEEFDPTAVLAAAKEGAGKMANVSGVAGGETLFSPRTSPTVSESDMAKLIAVAKSVYEQYGEMSLKDGDNWFTVDGKKLSDGQFQLNGIDLTVYPWHTSIKCSLTMFPAGGPCVWPGIQRSALKVHIKLDRTFRVTAEASKTYALNELQEPVREAIAFWVSR